MRPDSINRRLSLDTPLIAGDALAVMLSRVRDGQPLSAELPHYKEIREKMKPAVERVGDLAIVPISGVLARKPDIYELAFFGFEDMLEIDRMLREVTSDPNISGVLLDIDSPGGFVNGTPELGDLVARLAKIKPVVSHTSGMAASAAYWIAAQAPTVIASRSAIVGSIGVYAALYDLAAYYAEMGVKVEVFTNKEATFKAAGLPGTSLSDEQRAHFQARVQRDFTEFKAAVNGPRPQVGPDAMRGQTFNGIEAKKLGLVDGIGDRTFALATLRQKVKAKNSQGA
jgi:signal peptide peptidase SppA